MNLTIESFEHFKLVDTNLELVNAGKYGIHELVDGVFITKEITEDDFSKYQHTEFDLEDEVILGLFRNYSAYPFVELI